MLFAIIASGLWIANSVYSIGYMRAEKAPRQTLFYVCFAIAICRDDGVALAGNLFTLFLFYELLTVSTYPLVTHRGTAGGAQRRPALPPDAARRLDDPAAAGASAGPGSPPGRSISGAGGILGGTVSNTALGRAARAVRLRHRQGGGDAAAFLAAGGDGRADAGLGAASRRGGGQGRRLHHPQGDRLRLRRRDAGQGRHRRLAGLCRRRHRHRRLGHRAAARTTSSGGWPIRRSASSPMSCSAPRCSRRWPCSARRCTSPPTPSRRSRSSSPPARSTSAPMSTTSARWTASAASMPWTMGAFAVGSLSMIGVPPTVGFLGKWFILLAAVERRPMVRGRRHRRSRRCSTPAISCRSSIAPSAGPARARAAIAEAPWPMVVLAGRDRGPHRRCSSSGRTCRSSSPRC